jgi:large subunit ribosomal protein L16
MSLQPKKRKYRLCFRNKTERSSQKIPADGRLQKLINDHYLKTPPLVKALFKLEATAYGHPANHLPENTTPATWGEPSRLPFNYSVSQIQVVNKNRTAKNYDLLPAEKSFPLSSQARTNATLELIRFGTCGFYFSHSGTLSSKFIESTRLGVARKLKKSGRFWIRICADTPVTARSAETRMGRGKGAISHYEAKVHAGLMFLEFSGVSEEVVKLIFHELNAKTPIPIKRIG